MKNSKKADERAREEDRRPYEVGFGADSDFVVLLGEDPIEFEILRGRLAEEHAPDGPLEEDLVLTLAKCLWRKQRHQNFLSVEIMSAQYHPKHAAHHKQSQALETFYQAINDATSFEEIQQSLDQLDEHYADCLKFTCPRDNFREPRQWVNAMQKVVREAMRPLITLSGSAIASAVLTDDVIARELEFEARIDRILEQTLDRLERAKAAKRRVSFREAQRFSRSHSGRLVRSVK